MSSPEFHTNTPRRGAPRLAPATLRQEVKEVRKLMAEIRELARKTGTTDLPGPGNAQTPTTASERKASGIPAPSQLTTPRKTLRQSVSMFGLRSTAAKTNAALAGPQSMMASGGVIVRDFAYEACSQLKTPSQGDRGGGSRSLRRSVPNLTTGTTPSTLKAIQADMDDLKISYRNTIGPNLFAQTQKKTAASPGQKSTPTLKPTSAETLKAGSKAVQMKKMKSTPDLRRRVLGGATKVGDSRSSLRGNKLLGVPLPDQGPLQRGHASVLPPRRTPRPMTPSRRPALPRVRPRTGACPLPPPQKKGPSLSLDLSCAPATSPHLRPKRDIHESKLHKDTDGPHEELMVTDAVEISRFIQRLHAQDPHIHEDRDKPPSTTPPGSPKRTFASSTTPPGTPEQPFTPTLLAKTTADTPNRCSTPQPKPTKASLLRAAKGAARVHASTPSKADRFSTPRNRTIRVADPGASVTPSKAIVSALDRAIDAHLKQYAMEGKELTPAGQRISVLCEKRFGVSWSPKKETIGDLNGGKVGGEDFRW